MAFLVVDSSTGTSPLPRPATAPGRQANILLAYERGTVDRSSPDGDELALASVSVAGYRAGIEMADRASRAA